MIIEFRIRKLESFSELNELLLGEYRDELKSMSKDTASM